MSQKSGLIIMGKLPPPYFGPAIATEILLKSRLKEAFELTHIDTRLNKDVSGFGKFSFKKVIVFWGIVWKLCKASLKRNNKILLIPIAQTTGALLKDSVFIWIGKLTGKKVLIQLRGSNLRNWYTKQNGFFRWYFRLTLQRASAGLVLGEKLRDQFADFLPPEKIHVLPNGGDYPNAPGEIAPKKAFKLLYFSNFLHGKGFDLVLEAISLLSPEERQQISLDAVGSWDNEAFKTKCLKLIDDFHLPVRLHPPTSGDAKWTFFREASVLVFTPRHPEGHPWVTIEAMAFGLPVIATDQGAISESVLSGNNGYIIENDAPEQLSDKIRLLFKQPEKRFELSRNARQYYEQELTENKMIERYIKLFRSILFS